MTAPRKNWCLVKSLYCLDVVLGCSLQPFLSSPFPLHILLLEQLSVTLFSLEVWMEFDGPRSSTSVSGQMTFARSCEFHLVLSWFISPVFAGLISTVFFLFIDHTILRRVSVFEIIRLRSIFRTIQLNTDFSCCRCSTSSACVLIFLQLRTMGLRVSIFLTQEFHLHRSWIWQVVNQWSFAG